MRFREGKPTLFGWWKLTSCASSTCPEVASPPVKRVGCIPCDQVSRSVTLHVNHSLLQGSTSPHQIYIYICICSNKFIVVYLGNCAIHSKNFFFWGGGNTIPWSNHRKHPDGGFWGKNLRIQGAIQGDKVIGSLNQWVCVGHNPKNNAWVQNLPFWHVQNASYWRFFTWNTVWTCVCWNIGFSSWKEIWGTRFLLAYRFGNTRPTISKPTAVTHL